MDPETRNAILAMGLFFSRLNNLFELREKPDSPPIEGLPRYLTRQESAQMLNVSVKTIDRFVKSGKLPKRQLGESTRFLASDVEGLIH